MDENREFSKVLKPIRALQVNRMEIYIFAFFYRATFWKKYSRLKCALYCMQSYTRIVNLLNSNEYFKDTNIQKSTQTCIGTIHESRGAYK